MSLSERPLRKGISERAARGVVLALGNEILTDDGIGPVVVRRLKEKYRDVGVVDFVETNEMGLALLDFLEGYDWALIVDSMKSGRCEPASIRVFDRTDFAKPQAGNPHHMGVYDALVLAERLDLPVPADIRVVAIEVNDPFTFGTGLTPELERSSSRIVSDVSDLIREKLQGACTNTESPKRS